MVNRNILTLTVHPAIDINTDIDYVVPEKKLRCNSPRYEPGGGGINVSRAIAKLKGLSKAIYMAGGPTGDLLNELLIEEGIECRIVPVNSRTRENLIVLERSTGQQYRFGIPGLPINKEAWTECLLQINTLDPFPEFVVVSGSGALGSSADFYFKLSEIVREKKGKLIADNSGKDLIDMLLAGVYMIKPNLDELREICGCELRDEKEMVLESERIIRKGYAEIVVLSIGAAGAIYISESERGRIRAPTVPIRSKVGAGDSMVAGIVLSMSRGYTLREAVRYGVAAGASAVMTPGTELCRHEDTERLYAILMESD
jgi:6-phosphofructokinase 2